MRRKRVWRGVVAVVAGAGAVVAAPPAGAATPAPVVGIAAVAGGGYTARADGTVTPYGGAAPHGDLTGHPPAHPVVGIAATPDGGGYWLVASDGGIFAFGDAAFAGSTGSLNLTRPVVGMAATPDGHGYWLVASDGGVFAFGDAAFAGSTGGMQLTRPVVGMAPTPDGHGYWLVASDGGVFAFGDATFAGSTGGMRLNQPVLAIAPAPQGHGYWLVAADGGVFAFGGAPFLGSIGAGSGIAGIAVAPTGGYVLVGVDGSRRTFGVGGGGPLSGGSFFPPHPPDVEAAVAAARAAGDATGAAQLGRIAAQEVGTWLTGGDPSATVGAVVGAAAAAGQVPVLVVYDIPNRDCGGFSSGGAPDAPSYAAFVGRVASALAGRRAVVVLEPDALAGEGCLAPDATATRHAMLASAVSTLSAAGALVYLDAGHAGWPPLPTIVPRLEAAGAGRAAGVALDTSGFDTVGSEEAYGDALSAALGGAHFVIDTSRSGLGPAPGDAWCNPPGRALGQAPTSSTGDPLADALLWVKVPGESDGSCNGGPPAGQFWPAYAEGLVSRAG